MTDDDLKTTAARYALLPAVRAFLDREGCDLKAVVMLHSAFKQAVGDEVAKRASVEAA